MIKPLFFLLLFFQLSSFFSQSIEIEHKDSLNIDSSIIATNQFDKVTIIRDNRIDRLCQTYEESFKLMGYRIQIYSGDKKQPAKQSRLGFTRLYDEIPAYEIYEQPFFKVRVGDFKTKIEALKFKNEMINDFPNCFIVKDAINFKETID